MPSLYRYYLPYALTVASWLQHRRNMRTRACAFSLFDRLVVDRAPRSFSTALLLSLTTTLAHVICGQTRDSVSLGRYNHTRRPYAGPGILQCTGCPDRGAPRGTGLLAYCLAPRADPASWRRCRGDSTNRRWGIGQSWVTSHKEWPKPQWRTHTRPGLSSARGLSRRQRRR